MKKILTVLLCSVLLSGCSYLKSQIHEVTGQIFGNTYIVDTFDNEGNVVAQFKGDKISIKGNVAKTKDLNPTSENLYNYELSSVITITIDGSEIESCGDTLVFYDDRLSPDVAFDPDFSFESSSDGILDWASISGRLNEVKNMFGKSRIVLVKSQLGNPIYAFSGDDVYWELPKDLPKFTKIMIDGKALYIHRANFQILDKELLD